MTRNSRHDNRLFVVYLSVAFDWTKSKKDKYDIEYVLLSIFEPPN